MQVADARNLRRALMLTSQIADFGLPMILVLNMIDEAHARGISIDAEGLSDHLGIPVIEAVAPEGRGMAELRDALPSPAAARRAPHAGVPHLRWADETARRFRTHHAMSLGRFQEWLGRAVRQPLTGLPILGARAVPDLSVRRRLRRADARRLLEDGLFGAYLNPGPPRPPRTSPCRSSATSSSASTASSRWA